MKETKIKAALIVVDLQKGFLKDYPCYPRLDLTLEYVNETIDMFLEHDLPGGTCQRYRSKGREFSGSV